MPHENNTNANNKTQTYGLSTRVALARLHDDIERIVKEYEHKIHKESWFHKIRAAFKEPLESPLGWFASITTLITAIALIIAKAYIAGSLLIVILLLNIFIVVRENNLRITEIFRKTRHALEELRLAEEHLCADWQPCNYAHICCPLSPCVSLQWTYRDGVVVNLPWALLVQGDHIVLRPGHVTPAPCKEVNGRKSFNANEIYGVAHISDPPVKPVARSPLPDLICALETTPFLHNLHLILEQSLQRPPTIYNQQRYLLVTKYMQQWLLCLALAVTLLVGLLRNHGVGISSTVNESGVYHKWQHILLEAATVVLPLLPIIFPLLWISMNLWGVARLKCFLKTPQTMLLQDSQKSYEADLDTPTYNYDNISLLRSNVFRNWLHLWAGDSELLPRTSNVVQVMGSITALCCVDKKGILSWPNPTAEKVFFLHDKANDHLDDRSTDLSSSQTESDEPDEGHNKSVGIVAEVLDLTHDQHCPFRLEFDDLEWKTHIKSLKPLGLAILLNTCSPLTHAHYAQFCGHVTAVAMLDKDLVPVTNRYAIVESSLNSFMHGRCLCELAKQIGFTDHATDRFTLEGQLATYRHLQPDVIRRDIRFARQMQLASKVKVPFPHSLSVVMRENPGGYLSLFTQGTADIILDYCDDFWDGKDLHPLSQQDRKRALDFYQRSALTAYCTAFAYRPLRHGIHGALSGGAQTEHGPIGYLELPAESKIRMPHVDKLHCDFECGQGKLSHSISTDSLLYCDTQKDEDISDVEGCFEMQCHQVFIGMVTMQYQAQTDIVQLVEHLERACIRFVHFSKENELRSRVFSEKMGLESGWNCHISLLSESEDKAMINTGAQSPKSMGKNDITKNINTINHTTTTVTTSTQTENALTNMANHANAYNHGIITNNTNTTTSSSSSSSNNNNNSHITLATGTTTTTKAPSPLVTNISSSTRTTTITNSMHMTITDTSSPHKPSIQNLTGGGDDDCSELHCLLPPNNLESSKTLSNSAPGAISAEAHNYDVSPNAHTPLGSQIMLACDTSAQKRQSQDSAIKQEQENYDELEQPQCRSLSNLTESSEQSAPVHFDMSNRAKLPRGIENIRPHLEQVDNVPLQVSLFTDCSAEATRQMLDIMQSYGEIVVCLGSSASNANGQIFLQADCSIAVEPLYPQVCQDIAAYSDANIVNNKLRWRQQQQQQLHKNNESNVDEDLMESGLYGGSLTRAMLPPVNTLSPIYLSRLLNSLPCSISVQREDPLSLVAIIELSRRFSAGLWNCIQYWACCAGTLSALNLLSSCLTLPPILTPLMVLYLMCLPVPLIALALAHIDVDPKIMSRATGKKQTEYDSRAFGFVLWCYGCKFVTPVVIMILFYCAFMAHPIDILNINEENLQINLHIARHLAFLGIILHFVVISASFVHRDQSLWQKNPFRNQIWTGTCVGLLIVHTIICSIQMLHEDKVRDAFVELWPAVVFLYTGSVLSMIASEITKWQEIKVNTRYQRRARLDFGTKLGMNSPF